MDIYALQLLGPVSRGVVKAWFAYLLFLRHEITR
jgi:hypothetical protein